MIKHKNVFGVDISKDLFDVVSFEGTHNQFTNNENGFAAFAAELPKRALVVMESTGYYHFKLAQFLVSKKIKTSVINPLSIKRFRQMKLSKVKTDKADAEIICEYAKTNAVRKYKKETLTQTQCKQLMALADLYKKQHVSLKTKLKGEVAMGSPSPSVLRSIKRQSRTLLGEILEIEKEVNIFISKMHPEQAKLLVGIPGIGQKTSNYLILVTDGFRKFENSKQLSNFAGITPTITQSGTSIRGRSRISKMGNAKLRNLLFMCSFSACKYNKSCRELFDRIVSKGKSKKLALIAVCNKLLKQAFAIVQSGSPYNPFYKLSIKQPKPEQIIAPRMAIKELCL